MNKQKFDKLALDMALFIAGDNAQKQTNLRYWAQTFDTIISETKNPKTKCVCCKKHNSSWVFDYEIFTEERCSGCALATLLEHLVGMQNTRQP